VAPQPTGFQPLPNELSVSVEKGRGFGEREIWHHLLIPIMGSRSSSEKASIAMSANSSRNASTSPTGDPVASSTVTGCPGDAEPRRDQPRRVFHGHLDDLGGHIHDVGIAGRLSRDQGRARLWVNWPTTLTDSNTASNERKARLAASPDPGPPGSAREVQRTGKGTSPRVVHSLRAHRSGPRDHDLEPGTRRPARAASTAARSRILRSTPARFTTPDPLPRGRQCSTPDSLPFRWRP
jgi:hypothetical protein